MILLINDLIFSHTNYCSSIWGKCSEKLRHEVQKCINYAAKVASNWKYLKRNPGTPQLLDLKQDKPMEQPITVGCLENCDWLLHSFIEVNFSKLADSNQIFRNDFVCLYYHLSKISIQINQCKHFSPGTLYNTIYSMEH